MNIIKYIVLPLQLFFLLSCTPSKPYEARSPCVAIESISDIYGITPCVRKPINLTYAIV